MNDRTLIKIAARVTELETLIRIQWPTAFPNQQIMRVTGTVMPAAARAGNTGWPVRNDHCFQRIVLDTVCGGIWYDHIARPAYRHLSTEQADRVVRLCEAILAGTTDLADLNRKSLAWRASRHSRPVVQTGALLL